MKKAKPSKLGKGKKPKKIKKLKVPVTWLQDLNLNLIGIEGDGNCLFRALAHQLYGNQESHETIRKKICDYIMVERDYFGPYITERTFENYLNTMRLDGTWGGNLELQAFSEFYRKTIEIYTDSPIPEAHHVFGEAYSQASQERPIRLLFRGRHYESLLPTDVAQLILLEEEAGVYEDKQLELYTKLQHQKKSKVEEKPMISSGSIDNPLEKALAESLKLYELEEQRDVVRLKNKENLNFVIQLSLLKH